MRDHVRILGWLYIVVAAFNLAAGLFLLLALGGAAVIAHASAGPGGLPGVLAAFAMVLGGIMLVSALPSLVVGIGLLRWRPWARIVGVVLAVFHVLHFPVGTALSIYTFVVLLNPEVAAAFDRAPATGDLYPYP